MIVHKLSIKVFWGFVIHRHDAMGGETEAAPVGDEYAAWLERVVFGDSHCVPNVPLAAQPTLWRPLRCPDPLDPLDVRNYDGYAIAAGELLGVDVPRPTHGRYADPAWSRYWEACALRTHDAGAAFVAFGDDEDVEYVAVAEAKSVRETRFGPAALNLNGWLDFPDADLRGFCNKVGIQWREPGWFAAVRCCA